MGRHFFDTDDAEDYGVPAAIVINKLRFWIRANRQNCEHFHDGRWWTCQSLPALEKAFPYWKYAQLRRVIAQLVDQGVLQQAFGLDPQFPNRAQWLAFTDEQRWLGEKDAESAKSGSGSSADLRRCSEERAGSSAQISRCPEGSSVTPPFEADHLSAIADDHLSKTTDDPGCGEGHLSKTTDASVKNSRCTKEIDTNLDTYNNNDMGPGEPLEFGQPSWEIEALRLYTACLDDLMQYHRNEPGQSARRDYLRRFEWHLSAGRTISVEQVRAAVQAACESWRRKGIARCPVSAEPVLNELAQIVNPMPGVVSAGEGRQEGGEHGAGSTGSRSRDAATGAAGAGPVRERARGGRGALGRPTEDEMAAVRERVERRLGGPRSGVDRSG